MLLRFGCSVGSTCFRQNLEVHRFLIDHSPMRLFSTREYGAEQMTVMQKRNFDAQKWLEKLSPEMELKKKKIEFELQALQDQGRLLDYEIQLADMKHILTECETRTSLLRYLDFRTKKQKLKKKKKEKKEKKETSFDAGDVNVKDPDKFGVFPYTIPNNQQRVRISKHNAAMSFLNDNVPVVFDMDFNMNRREEVRAVEQILLSYNAMYKYIEPCELHVTSCMESSYLNEKFGDAGNSFIQLHEEYFGDLFPKKNLVYLSPDGPELTHHIPGDIYVIGGIVDLHYHKPYSLRRAMEMGIRCGSIPFMKHGLMPSIMKTCFGQVLTLNKVFELVMKINLKHQWSYVMNDYIREHGLERKRKAKKEKVKLFKTRGTKKVF